MVLNSSQLNAVPKMTKHQFGWEGLHGRTENFYKCIYEYKIMHRRLNKHLAKKSQTILAIFYDMSLEFLSSVDMLF